LLKSKIQEQFVDYTIVLQNGQSRQINFKIRLPKLIQNVLLGSIDLNYKLDLKTWCSEIHTAITLFSITLLIREFTNVVK